MKSTIKIAMTLLAFVWASTVSAQDLNKRQKQALDEQVQEMVDVMGLDKDQQAKVVEIKTKQFHDRNALAKQYERQSDEFKSKVKEINKAAWQEVKAICTKDQLKKWSKREK